MPITYLDETPIVEGNGRRVTYLNDAPSDHGRLERRSALSTPFAKGFSSIVGTGAGGWAGARQGAMLAAKLPIPHPLVKAGVVAGGAVLGAGAGNLFARQAQRMGAAQIEQDDPTLRREAFGRSVERAPRDFGQGVATELTGQALRPLMPIVGRGYTRLREFMTGVEPGSSARVLERGRQIIKPEYREGAPRSVTKKVQDGVNFFLQKARRDYRTVTPKVKAELESKFVNLNPHVAKFRQSLVDADLIDPSGRPLRGLLPKGAAAGSDRDARELISILRRIESVGRRTRPGRLGGARGYVRADEIHRTINQIDDAVTYSRRGVNPIGDRAEALLKGLRRDLMDVLGQQVKSLSARNAAYAGKIELYEDVQKKLTNESVAGTVKAMATRSNEFPFPELMEINRKVPKSMRFMDTVQDYLAGREFVRAPGLSRATMQLAAAGPGIGFTIMKRPLEAVLALGSAGVAMSPSLYARELALRRMMAPFMRRAVPPALKYGPSAASGLLSAAEDE